MRPYLAIIWDSFYQAVVSWLLWIVLGATVLVLVLFAGLTYREELNTRLTMDEVSDWKALAEKLDKERQQITPAPGKHLYELFTSDVQRAVEALAKPTPANAKPMEEFTLAAGLAAELSRIMSRDDFYDRASFAGVKVSAEGRDLLARSDLAPQEVARRNRLLLEGAYPDLVKVSPRYGAQFYYYHFKLLDPVPMRNEQVVEMVQGLIYLMLYWFVSIVGIMVSIVLTSWQIPFLFEEGSIVLLLSKPISRSLLFISKCVGACAFTLITTAFFIFGLYVLAGARFGVWLPNMLWCIPIFVFVFAIYYSVSAVCALLSRSTIVSIVLSLVGVFVFFLLCFFVGLAKTRWESMFVQKLQIVKVAPADDRTFAVNEVGEVLRWDASLNNWQIIMANEKDPMAQLPPYFRQPRGTIGPVYDPEGKQLIALDEPIPGFPILGAEQPLAVGKEAQSFRYRAGVSAPAGTLALFADREGKVLAVSRTGVHRLNSAQAVTSAESRLIRMILPLGKGKGPFESLGPEGLYLREPASAAMNADTNDLATYSAGVLTVLKRTPEGKYVRGHEVTFGGDAKPGLVAFGGSTILLALSDGSINTYDAGTLEPRSSWEPEGKNKPRFVYAAPGGKWFAVLFHSGVVWLLDAEADDLRRANIRGQGGISGAALVRDNRLLVVDRTNRVTTYDLESGKRVEELAPALTGLEKAYYWLILPAYIVLPKPGELNNTVSYVLTKHEAGLAQSLKGDSDLQSAQVKYDPWSPVISSAVFIVVMLAYGCWKIERMEF